MRNPGAEERELFFQGIIDFTREVLNEDLFRANHAFFTRLGLIFAPIGAFLGLIIGVMGAVKTDSFTLFTSGVAWIVVAAFAYYIGSALLDSCDSAIDNNPTEVSSLRILDAFAAIVLLLVVGLVCVTGFFSIKMDNYEAFKFVLPIVIVLAYFVCLLLNPVLLSTTETVGSSAGEDFLAVSSIINKAVTRLSGITYGSLITLGSLYLGYSLYEMLADGEKVNLLAMVSAGWKSFLGAFLYLFGLIYPFIAYLVFISGFLIIDLARSILAIRSIRDHLYSPPQARTGGVASHNGPGPDTPSSGRERIFHYALGDPPSQTRFVGETELLRMHASGGIANSTLIWTDGMAGWRSFATVFPERSN